MPRDRSSLTLAVSLVAVGPSACSGARAEWAGQSVGNASARAGQAVEGLTAKTGREVGTASDPAGRFFERGGERIRGEWP